MVFRVICKSQRFIGYSRGFIGESQGFIGFASLSCEENYLELHPFKAEAVASK